MPSEYIIILCFWKCLNFIHWCILKLSKRMFLAVSIITYFLSAHPNVTQHHALLSPWWTRCNFAASLPQASPTSSNELPGCQHLRLQQWDVCERTLGPAHPAWVQAAGDGQSQQTAVCAVEPQQPVSADGTESLGVCLSAAKEAT